MTVVEHRGDLMTVAEAASALRCHEQTVRRLIRTGAIEAVQLGGRGAAIRIPAEALRPQATAPSTFSLPGRPRVFRDVA
jgi:excisionase family DNA binding protein